MPTNGLKVYIRYEQLYLADFRALVADIERAYNRVDAAAANSLRIRRRRRLTVETIRTGKSVETIIHGSIFGIPLFYLVLRKAIKLRQEFWASEEQKWKAHEQKWKAKGAEQRLLTSGQTQLPDGINIMKFREQLEDDPRLRQAEEILVKRIERVEKSRAIHSVEVEMGDTAELQRGEKPDRS